MEQSIIYPKGDTWPAASFVTSRERVHENEAGHLAN